MYNVRIVYKFLERRQVGDFWNSGMQTGWRSVNAVIDTQS